MNLMSKKNSNSQSALLTAGSLTFSTFCLTALVSITFLPELKAQSESNNQPTSDKRRIALSLPKTSSKQVEIPNWKSASSVIPSQSSAGYFRSAHEMRPEGKGPNEFAKSRSERIPDNVRESLLDCAEKIEFCTRSYNRRVADTIVWIVRSLHGSSVYTPAVSPSMQRQRPTEFSPLDETNKIFQID